MSGFQRRPAEQSWLSTLSSLCLSCTRRTSFCSCQQRSPQISGTKFGGFCPGKGGCKAYQMQKRSGLKIRLPSIETHISLHLSVTSQHAWGLQHLPLLWYVCLFGYHMLQESVEILPRELKQQLPKTAISPNLSRQHGSCASGWSLNHEQIKKNAPSERLTWN